MERWNTEWQKFRKVYLHQVSRQCKPPKQLFLLGCEDEIRQTVIDIYKDRGMVNETPFDVGIYDPHYCLARLRTHVRIYIRDEQYCWEKESRIIYDPESITFVPPMCRHVPLHTSVDKNRDKEYEGLLTSVS